MERKLVRERGEQLTNAQQKLLNIQGLVQQVEQFTYLQG